MAKILQSCTTNRCRRKSLPDRFAYPETAFWSHSSRKLRRDTYFTVSKLLLAYVCRHSHTTPRTCNCDFLAGAHDAQRCQHDQSGNDFAWVFAFFRPSLLLLRVVFGMPFKLGCLCFKEPRSSNIANLDWSPLDRLHARQPKSSPSSQREGTPVARLVRRAERLAATVKTWVLFVRPRKLHLRDQRR